MSWTRIVTFSGSFERGITKFIYIKPIEMTHVIRCGMLHFLRLRKHLG
jgi:hypothetical protein